MNTKTTVAFTMMSAVALVLLIAFASIVGSHQTFAYGSYGGPSGYYGPLGPYYGQTCYYGCYGSSSSWQHP